MPPRNILLFLTDGHRYDGLHCNGNDVLQTPNLNCFAGAGVRCTGAFSTHTVCMPTRASIFTGRYPHVHGVWANGIPLPAGEITMAQTLADHGYRTFAAGKIHFEPQEAPDFPPDVAAPGGYYGFGEVHLTENRQGPEYLDSIDADFSDLREAARRRDPVPETAHELTWITDRTIYFLERQAGGDAPFFCSWSCHELTPPCNLPADFQSLYDAKDIPPPKRREGELDGKPAWYRQCHEGSMRVGRYPDDERYGEIMVTYYDMATFIDRQFGRVAAALEQLGLAEDTIVLFTADHGLVLGDHWLWRHGPFLYDQVIHVPMIWRVPGMAGGRVADGLCEGVDIMPTLLDLAGVTAPPGVQGRSMSKMLAGEAPGRESILAQERESPELIARGLDPAGFRCTCLRTRDWKLIHYPGKPYGELYDLENDPDEYDNLWADPARRARRRQLEIVLLDRLHEAEDPLPERHFMW